MTRHLYPLTWLPLLALTAATCIGAAAQGPTTPAASVTLRFHNGSVIQPAVLLDPVEIETKFGKLSVPPSEIRRIDFGFRHFPGVNARQAPAVDVHLHHDPVRFGR